MRRTITAAALAAMASLLTACGPIYGTEARLTPPESAEARNCTAKCRATRQSCKDAAESRADARLLQCESDADRRFQQCLLQASDAEERTECRPRTCSRPVVDTTPCEDDFHACYADCGGTVEFERVCQFNCP